MHAGQVEEFIIQEITIFFSILSAQDKKDMLKMTGAAGFVIDLENPLNILNKAVPVLNRLSNDLRQPPQELKQRIKDSVRHLNVEDPTGQKATEFLKNVFTVIYGVPYSPDAGKSAAVKIKIDPRKKYNPKIKAVLERFDIKTQAAEIEQEFLKIEEELNPAFIRLTRDCAELEKDLRRLNLNATDAGKRFEECSAALAKTRVQRGAFQQMNQVPAIVTAIAECDKALLEFPAKVNALKVEVNAVEDQIRGVELNLKAPKNKLKVINDIRHQMDIIRKTLQNSSSNGSLKKNVNVGLKSAIDPEFKKHSAIFAKVLGANVVYSEEDIVMLALRLCPELITDMEAAKYRLEEIFKAEFAGKVQLASNSSVSRKNLAFQGVEPRQFFFEVLGYDVVDKLHEMTLDKEAAQGLQQAQKPQGLRMFPGQNESASSDELSSNNKVASTPVLPSSGALGVSVAKDATEVLQKKAVVEVIKELKQTQGTLSFSNAHKKIDVKFDDAASQEFLGACFQGQLDKVKSSKAKGANINVVGSPDAGGSCTGLQLAVLCDKEEVVAYLLQQPNLNIINRNVNGRTAIQLALDHQRLGMAQMISGLSVNLRLLNAASGGRLGDIEQALLEGADVNAINPTAGGAFSALQLAIQYGRANVIPILLAAGADLEYRSNIFQSNAQELANNNVAAHPQNEGYRLVLEEVQVAMQKLGVKPKNV